MPEYVRAILTAGLGFLIGYWLRSLKQPLPPPQPRKPRSITTTFQGNSIKTTLE